MKSDTMDNKKSKWQTWHTVVVVSVVVLGVIGLTSLGAIILVQSYVQKSEGYERSLALQKQAHIPSGVLVVKTDLFSKAQRIGLKAGDIITGYNDEIVVDYSSYRDAVDKYIAGERRG